MYHRTLTMLLTFLKQKRKIDWNGVIIKELRKVFKTAHMKPLKKMSTNGKEENAPWREWFAAASDRGVETQLPPDILKKARERYPLPPQNGMIFIILFNLSFYADTHPFTKVPGHSTLTLQCWRRLMEHKTIVTYFVK